MSVKYLDFTGLSHFLDKIKTIFAPISHTHGNVTNDGKLQTNDVAIADGDKLVITDASDSGKVARTSAAFDGSTTNKALTPKGTFETFLQSHQDISGKADKVTSATSGNFAGLDANGNLTDSGSKASDFKTVQTAVNDPSASGDAVSFIDSISQNTNGVISATKKTVSTMGASGTNHAAGLVPDPGATAGTSKYLREDGTWVTPPDTKNTAGSTNSELKIYIVGATEQGANPQTYSNSNAYVDKGAVYSEGKKVLTDHQDISGKADIVSGATANNFMAFDANGNIKDSGKSASDFIAATAKGAASGVCPLNASSKIDSTYLPGYVDDVIEAYPVSGKTELDPDWLALDAAGQSPITPEAGKIYILMADSTSYATNSEFRWGGSKYVKMNDGGVSAITNAEIDTLFAA